ncbi:MAG: MFS transporter [Chitinivibrionales bacterium]|nr:MFS transporter [Chitinivibrionales bacterium]
MDKRKKTFILDTIRGGADGVLAAIVNTILLLVAIEVFNLSDSWKALIASAPFIGCIFSLVYSARFADTSLRKSLLASAPMGLCCVFTTMLLFTSDGIIFSIIATIAMSFAWMRIPFLSAIYQENYSARERGTLYSWSLIATISVTITCSYAFGRLLDINLALYRLIIGIAAVASAVSTVAVFLIPSSTPDMQSASNPLKNLSLIWKNKLFGYILFSWFITGFANLWTRALRIEYLAESKGGLDLSPLMVMVIAGVIPEAARLIFIRFWAHLFDRINFIVLRITLNLFLGFGLLIYFISENPVIIGAGSFLFGICLSGGVLAWNLWITKFAPAGQAHIYMSIHVFLMGVRGIIAPRIGFFLTDYFPFRIIGIASFCMILIASAMLVPVIKMANRLEQ